jgi:2-amino-4-hydroxy-6-hydroxymethyldihydropteridine diphosphokinase
LIAYLGLGSNIDASKNIDNAKQLLNRTFKNSRFSRTFESEAIGFEGDNFLNCVAEIYLDETLESLILRLKQLEDELGRQRGGAKFSSRHIDIDILLFGDLVCQTPIQLPRDEIRVNAYVLWPLAELAPELIEPGGSLTYSALWKSFDKSKQNLFPVK